MKRTLVVVAATAGLLAGCGPGAHNVNSGASATSSLGSSALATNNPSSAPAGNGILEVASRFGLLGRWALDCGQPPSGNNEYSEYTAGDDGSLHLTYDSGPEMQPNEYTYTSAQITGDEIQMDGVYNGNGETQHTTMRKNSQGQLKVWRNLEGDEQKVLVDNGEFPDGGGPAWENKCS